MTGAAKVKVVMSKNSLHVKAGDTLTVDPKTADRLVKLGHATRAPEPKPKTKE